MWIKKIIKAGDSLAVTLPPALCRDLEINRGDFVFVVVGFSNNILLKKIDEETAKSFLAKDIQYEK